MSRLPFSVRYPLPLPSEELPTFLLDLRYERVLREGDIQYLSRLIEDLEDERRRLESEISERNGS